MELFSIRIQRTFQLVSTLIIQSNSLFYPKRFWQRLPASPLPFILISVNPFAKRKSEQNRLILQMTLFSF